MEITFKMNSKKSIMIMEGENYIGRIFTPSGTSQDIPNAIQVCGFDDCFSLWGCGVFDDGHGNPKKDIQLLFNKNSQMDLANRIKFDLSNGCGKCFSPKDKCKCADLRVKELKEIIIDKVGGKI